MVSRAQGAVATNYTVRSSAPFLLISPARFSLFLLLSIPLQSLRCNVTHESATLFSEIFLPSFHFPVTQRIFFLQDIHVVRLSLFPPFSPRYESLVTFKTLTKSRYSIVCVGVPSVLPEHRALYLPPSFWLSTFTKLFPPSGTVSGALSHRLWQQILSSVLLLVPPWHSAF